MYSISLKEFYLRNGSALAESDAGLASSGGGDGKGGSKRQSVRSSILDHFLYGIIYESVSFRIESIRSHRGVEKLDGLDAAFRNLAARSTADSEEASLREVVDVMCSHANTNTKRRIVNFIKLYMMIRDIIIRAQINCNEKKLSLSERWI